MGRNTITILTATSLKIDKPPVPSAFLYLSIGHIEKEFSKLVLAFLSCFTKCFTKNEDDGPEA